MSTFVKSSLVGVLAVAPLATYAATLTDIVNTVGNLISLATPIVLALALVYFFWGLANFILSSGEADKRNEAIAIMIYGVIALFVMVSVWGIVNVLQSTFQVQSSGDIRAPSVQGVGR